MDAKHKVSLEVDLSEGTASLVAVVTTALTLVAILEKVDRIRSQS